MHQGEIKHAQQTNLRHRYTVNKSQFDKQRKYFQKPIPNGPEALNKAPTSVQTLTLGTEFVSFKSAVEHTKIIHYYLRTMGAKVTKATTILCDNKGVVINSKVPQSTMNKKTIALTYQYVREHQANNMVNICFIPREEEYADAFTKALDSTVFNDSFCEIMAN